MSPPATPVAAVTPKAEPLPDRSSLHEGIDALYDAIERLSLENRRLRAENTELRVETRLLRGVTDKADKSGLTMTGVRPKSKAMAFLQKHEQGGTPTYTVCKGSIVTGDVAESVKESRGDKLRDERIKDGTLEPIEVNGHTCYQLTRDVECSSWTAAQIFCLGYKGGTEESAIGKALTLKVADESDDLVVRQLFP